MLLMMMTTCAFLLRPSATSLPDTCGCRGLDVASLHAGYKCLQPRHALALGLFCRWAVYSGQVDAHQLHCACDDNTCSRLIGLRSSPVACCVLTPGCTTTCWV
jgi:hypothetical protein